MISMATEHSAFQTICAITTMAVATQRYVNLKCFCFKKSNDLFLKLIFTVLFKLYIQIKSFIYINIYIYLPKRLYKGDHMTKTNQLQF